MKRKSEINQTLTLIDSTTNTSDPIALKDINESERTLGVRLCPDGNMRKEREWLHDKAKNFAKLLRSSHFHQTEAYAAYVYYYIASITYSLPLTTFTKTECKNIQSSAINAILPALGFNQHMP
jgi:hypothetical protein